MFFPNSETTVVRCANLPTSSAPQISAPQTHIKPSPPHIAPFAVEHDEFDLICGAGDLICGAAHVMCVSNRLIMTVAPPELLDRKTVCRRLSAATFAEECESQETDRPGGDEGDGVAVTVDQPAARPAHRAPDFEKHHES